MTTKVNIIDQHLENQDWLKRLDFYKEEIWIVLPSIIQNNEELIPALEKAPWFFGRFCYCKGLAGYSEISDKRVVINKDNTIEISFSPSKGETKMQKIQWVFAKN